MDSFIFDIDGTLWDSTDAVARSWMEYIQKNTHYHPEKELTGDLLKQYFGMILSDIAANVFADLSEEERLPLIRQCCRYENEYLQKHPVSPYAGVSDTLKLLAEKYPLFIVSNCEAGYIETFLESTGLTPYIQDHLCPGDTSLPKWDNIRTIVQKHQLASPVYVGDTNGDHLACQKAGVPFIFASYGFGQTEQPFDIIDKFTDLKKFL